MSYSQLLPLMKRVGSTCSSEVFQEKVNIVFHNHEALYYDQLHNDMTVSLQEQTDLLIADYSGFAEKSNLSLLDVGCGTGMSSQRVMNSQLKDKISKVTLLDTSPVMLQKATEKAQTWGIPFEVKEGYVSSLTEKFDIIIICSVLHHIPDLTSFLADINRLLNTNGILIHLQDPNADFLNDSELKQRMEQLQTASNKTTSNEASWVTIIPKPIRKWFKRLIGRKDYIDLINDELLAEGIIKRRMTADEIWSVTDIQIIQKNGEESGGISMRFLEDKLTNFRQLSKRSYGFFGPLKSELPQDFAQQEAELISKKALNGRNVAAIWIKN